MTTHELARLLLIQPDMPVAIRQEFGLRTVQFDTQISHVGPELDRFRRVFDLQIAFPGETFLDSIKRAEKIVPPYPILTL